MTREGRFAMLTLNHRTRLFGMALVALAFCAPAMGQIAGAFTSYKKHCLCFGLLMTSIVDGSNPARAHSRSHRRLACRLVAMGCAFDVAVVTARPHPGAALRRRRAAPGAQVPGPALPTVSVESRLYWTAPGRDACIISPRLMTASSSETRLR